MASGDTLLEFFPAMAEAPATLFALQRRRNGHPTLVFDGSTNWSTIFTAIMPEHYTDGGLTIDLYFSVVGITGDVDWDVAIERIALSSQDIDADGFAAVNSIDGTSVPGTSGHVVVATVTFVTGADMDSVVAGDLFRLQVTRDAASDVDNTDAELLGIHVKES